MGSFCESHALLSCQTQSNDTSQNVEWATSDWWHHHSSLPETLILSSRRYSVLKTKTRIWAVHLQKDGPKHAQPHHNYPQFHSNLISEAWNKERCTANPPLILLTTCWCRQADRKSDSGLSARLWPRLGLPTWVLQNTGFVPPFVTFVICFFLF